MFKKLRSGWYCHADNISDMTAEAFRGQLAAMDPDVVLNIETHMFNVTLEADTCLSNLDLGKDVWLNRSRWSRLIKEYVPREPLERFLDQAVEILDGRARLGATANMFFRDPERYAKKHRWGGCLMGATFRGDSGKSGRATLTFYSRTTYMGYMALLDAAIAAVMAREICKRYNQGKGRRSSKRITPEDLSFRWHISSMQLHCFKSLPYIYSQPDLMEKLERIAPSLTDKSRAGCPPAWWHISKWYNKVTKAWSEANHECKDMPSKSRLRASCLAMLAAEKYGPFKRIKRRWLEFKGYSTKNLPPSLFVKDLDFDKAI